MNVKHLIQCLVSSKCSVNLNCIIIIIFLIMQSKPPWEYQCGCETTRQVLLKLLLQLPLGDTDELIIFTRALWTKAIETLNSHFKIVKIHLLIKTLKLPANCQLGKKNLPFLGIPAVNGNSIKRSMFPLGVCHQKQHPLFILRTICTFLEMTQRFPCSLLFYLTGREYQVHQLSSLNSARVTNGINGIISRKLGNVCN